MSLTDVAKEGIHLSRFLREMGLESLANVQMFNQAAGKLAHNPVFYSKSKHIDVKFHFIQKTLKRHPIKQEYLPTEFMVADILTKGLPYSRYEKLIEGLRIMETSSHRSDWRSALDITIQTVRCNRSEVISAPTLTLFSIHDTHLPNLISHCPLLLIFTFIFLLT